MKPFKHPVLPLAVASVCLAATAVLAQQAPTNGPRRVDPRWHALVGADVVVRPGDVVENATVVLRDGVIVSVEPAGQPPEGARRWDYTGLTIYPGFVDAYAEVDAPKPDESAEGAHWRSNVTPQRSALDGEGLSADQRKALRELGFAAAAIAPSGGVFRGSGALVALGDDADLYSAEAHAVIEPLTYHAVAFETGGWSGPPPTSQMGAIAVIRQTLLDADWHADAKVVYTRDPSMSEPPERNDALDALGRNQQSAPPLLFVTDDELEALRAAKIAREFDRRAIVRGSGMEFRRLDPVAAEGLSIIAPVDFPDAPDVSSIAAAEDVSLRELMTWEQAPTNLRRLDDAGAQVAVTAHGLDKKSDFWPNLRKAVAHGLPEDRALAMLTTQPAEILGASGRLGAVEPGMLANLVAVDGDLFDKDATIRDVWTLGRRFEINPPPMADLDGTWAMNVGGDFESTITISGDAKKIAMTADDAETKARSIERTNDRLSFIIDGEPFGEQGVYSMTAVVEGDRMLGDGRAPGGNAFTWTAERTGDGASAEQETGDTDEGDEGEDDQDAESYADVPDQLPTPFGAYGLTEAPQRESVLITGATIWTAADEGIIEDGALLVVDGKIRYVGPAARTPRMAVDRTIDGEGLHVTPGLIDCHSHTGISSGVNEGGQAVTAEVRIADVIDPDDIAWYRELAGGLTAANQLHGSANPIGGQNSVVKLRWGAGHPDAMRIDSASEGIKFALGENVVNDRWDERYPQSRMGVETLIRDRFVAAREYADDVARYEGLSADARAKTTPPRTDLELEALAEILAGDRLIHCHSYRQDEILMLCRVAQEFGFTIGTFQHVLEGYKVAGAIKEAAIGASSFSDWWAYKFEVYDAIPFNGALMHEVGVNVSFNSDSSELARRMNTEAAKAVRYGGVEPHEALKFVTINPAIQLKIDDRTGSLEAGKDADVAIWSGDPLSTMTRCVSTWVDGAEVFSLERDAELRQRDRAQRQRLIQKILAEGKPKGEAPEGDPPTPRGVDTPTNPELAERQRHLEAVGLEMLRSGLNPDEPGCGECGFMGRMGHKH